MENSAKGLSTLTGLFTGTVIGLAVGILTAPKSGEESREEIKEKVSESTDKLKESALSSGKQLAEKVSSVNSGNANLEKLRTNVDKLSQDLNNMIEKQGNQ